MMEFIASSIHRLTSKKFHQHRNAFAAGHDAHDHYAQAVQSCLRRFARRRRDQRPVSERSKPASRERMKTSHFEERIALRAVETAQRRDESTQRELATFDNDFGGA